MERSWYWQKLARGEMEKTHGKRRGRNHPKAAAGLVTEVTEHKQEFTEKDLGIWSRIACIHPPG